jgi:arylsulfatase
MIELNVVDSMNHKLVADDRQYAWRISCPGARGVRVLAVPAHAAMIDRMDEGLGKVFQALKDTGKWDNTLIFVLSDNGAALNVTKTPVRSPEPARAMASRSTTATKTPPAGGRRAQLLLHRPRLGERRNTPYRKWKASQYNGGERTPMIVHWPAGLKVQRDGFVRARGHVIDLMATALDVAGARTARDVRRAEHRIRFRHVTLAVLQGQLNLRTYPPLLASTKTVASVITPDGWKLVRDRGESAWHLYDLSVDESSCTT